MLTTAEDPSTPRRAPRDRRPAPLAEAEDPADTEGKLRARARSMPDLDDPAVRSLSVVSLALAIAILECTAVASGLA